MKLYMYSAHNVTTEHNQMASMPAEDFLTQSVSSAMQFINTNAGSEQ